LPRREVNFAVLQLTTQPTQAHGKLVYFSNGKLTIAATIEVKEISGGVRAAKGQSQVLSWNRGPRDLERELKSAQPREYTYVPVREIEHAR